MLTVVTAIFGKGFRLHDPVEHWSGCRFVCFTDRNDLKSSVWKFKRQSHKLTPRRANRHVKTLLHRYVDGPTLYSDSEFRLVKDPQPIVAAALERAPIAATKHPRRACLFDEADFCLLKKRVESPRMLREQADRYAAEGMPRGFGLTANNILARRGDEDSERIGELWWSELDTGSERDQVSLPYVLWKTGIKPSIIQGAYNHLDWIERKKSRRQY